MPPKGAITRSPTFDMAGDWRQAKLAGRRPLDGGVGGHSMTGRCLHIGRSVLMDELPLAFHKQGLEVVIWITPFVAVCSVADFEVHDFFGGFVYQAVSVSRTRLETRAHPWRKLGSPFVRVQSRAPAQDVDELVLPAVSVTKGRHRIGSQAREVYAEVREAKKIPKWAFLPAGHARCKRFGVGGRLASDGYFGGTDRDWSLLF